MLWGSTILWHGICVSRIVTCLESFLFLNPFCTFFIIDTRVYPSLQLIPPVLAILHISSKSSLSRNPFCIFFIIDTPTCELCISTASQVQRNFARSDLVKYDAPSHLFLKSSILIILNAGSSATASHG